MRIRTKITLLFFLLFLAPFILIGTLSYQNGRNAVQESLGSSFQQLAREAIDKVDRHLFGVYLNIQTWSELTLMQEIITGDLDAKISEFLIETNKKHRYLSSISVVTMNGEVVAASKPQLLGGILKKSALAKANPGRPYVEDARFDELDQAWVISFFFPIKAQFEAGKVIGGLHVNWKVEELDQITQIQKEHEGDYHNEVIVLRKDGMVLSAPKAARADRFERNLVKAGLTSAMLATQGEKGYLVEADERGNVLLIGYDFSKGFRAYEGLGWVTLAVEDVDMAFAAIEKLKSDVYKIGGILALFIMAFSLILSKRMTKPIVELARAASRVAQGDFEGKVKEASSDEIGSLAKAFNKMTKDLKNQRSQITSAKDYADSILENMMNSLIVIDADDVIRTANKATLRMLGYQEEELVGQEIEIILPEDSLDWASKLRDLAEKGEVNNVEIIYISKDGKEIPVIFSGTLMRNKQGIQGVICVAQDISERRLQTAELKYQATHDALTLLANRTLLSDHLDQAILMGKRAKKPVALLIMDLDRFKEINDTLGHSRGDVILKQIGQRLRSVIRESDTIARLGGDEFAVLLPATDVQGAVEVTEKILRTIEAPFELDGIPIAMEISVGIAVWPSHGENSDHLLQRADMAMYIAKRSGSGHAVYKQENDQYSPSRLGLMGELRSAIKGDGLMLYYQPQIDLSTNRVVGVEALLRWDHPKHGLLLPFKFIPLAEQSGLMKPLTLWVLNDVLRQVHLWYKRGINIYAAVNLSARILLDRQIPSQIKELLSNWDISPSRLELEITESAIMTDPARAMEILMTLSQMGIRLSIDDFGTGYSSLGYLKKLPVDVIKIDKSFVIDMASSSDDATIVRSTIDLGHNLSLKVLAEGVENQTALDKLIGLGCDAAQGYYMSVPLAVPELERWLEESPWGLSGGRSKDGKVG